MNQGSAQLMAALEAFELDERGAVDPFSTRLARENAWSELYARRVIREYKRFLALAVSAPHTVTPSEDVDQAWHLHLLYSASYREFCSQVLGRPLDHGPSRGGRVELQHFTSAYAQTLLSYQQRFGEAAPEDIWPPVAERFRPGRSIRRVDDTEHWLLRKPGLWRWLERHLRLRALSWLKLSLLGLAGLVGSISLSWRISGHQYLVGYLLFWLSSLLAAYGAKRLSAPDVRANDAVDALEPYALLQLARGPESAVDGALTALIAQQVLAFDQETSVLRIVGALPVHAAELERRVFFELGQATDPAAAVLRRLSPKLTLEIAAQLEALGLMTSGKEQLPFWLALSAPVLGSVRIVSRLGSDKPVLGLVFLCILSVFVARLFRAKVERTPRGQALLDKARVEHRESSGSELASAGLVPLAIALFGVAAVGLPGVSTWTSWLDRTSLARTSVGASADTSGGCGGGDGCGGGGCGGGCGGCGG